MKRNGFYFVIFLVIFLFASQGCAASTYITSKKGTIKVGMTKEEVVSTWGEPRHKVPPEEKTSIAYNENRYEFWEYSSAGILGHTTLVTFNKDGLVTDIETLYK